MSTDRCLFCDVELKGNATNEHIIPRWLSQELGIAQDWVNPTHLRAQDGSVASQRLHKVSNLVEGRVCARCNSGWMSALESEARPLLTSLIHGKRTIWTLDGAEGALLARWTMKTVAVLNSASNYDALVPASHFRATRDGHIPDQVAVYAGQASTGDPAFGWIQSSTWMTSARVSRRRFRALTRRSYKIALRFGRLLLMAAYWAERGWQQVRWKGVHYLLSSPTGLAYLRDPAKFEDDQVPALMIFLGTLEVLDQVAADRNLGHSLREFTEQ